jgi:UDP-N-acetylglucosamine--N-acetylmuramyl-(pentapeptide) pyrophosphoryl-undecaprenol N-acetylglucosamine transferase
MNRIVFTGGGTGGHIIPNVAIIQKIKQEFPDLEILYIGSRKGPEAKMIPEMGIVGVSYKAVATGKLRRYFSWQNFVDFFKIPVGVVQSWFALRKFKPAAIFSKGGYVSIPVTYAAHFLKIPIILHESDITPGLANRLAAKKADVICLAYEESVEHFEKHDGRGKREIIVTGNPVRESLFKGNVARGLKFAEFKENDNGGLRTILVMGGSQGAQAVNEAVFKAAGELLANFRILHICGKGKMPENFDFTGKYRARYKAFEYIDKEMADLYAITNLAIARSGANTLVELDALGIPAILVPIGSSASRGEQMLNALSYKKSHSETEIIANDDLNEGKLINAVKKVSEHKRQSVKKVSGVVKIIEVLKRYIS